MPEANTGQLTDQFSCGSEGIEPLDGSAGPLSCGVEESIREIRRLGYELRHQISPVIGSLWVGGCGQYLWCRNSSGSGLLAGPDFMEGSGRPNSQVPIS